MFIGSTAVCPPTIARRYAPELLDVDVDHRTRVVVFETQGGAHLLAGRWVQIRGDLPSVLVALRNRYRNARRVSQ